MDLRRTLLLLLSFIFTAHAWAQIAGGLQGRVTDSSGASIARAQVTLTRTSTGVRQSDRDDGGRLLCVPAVAAG